MNIIFIITINHNNTHVFEIAEGNLCICINRSDSIRNTKKKHDESRKQYIHLLTTFIN